MSATRRDFFRIAGASGAAAAGLVALGPAQRAAAFDSILAADTGDAVVLKTALELEDQAIFTYSAAAGMGLLSPVTLQVAVATQADHRAHRQFLADAISSLGGEPPVAKESYPLPTALTDEKAVLTAAAGLEETAVQAYFAAIRRLVRRDLRQSLASILAVEAQHVVVFRSALKLDPVPNAFIDLGL